MMPTVVSETNYFNQQTNAKHVYGIESVEQAVENCQEQTLN